MSRSLRNAPGMAALGAKSPSDRHQEFRRDMTEKAASSASDVALRDVSESDLETFFQDQLDPKACRMAGFPPRDRDAFTSHWIMILR